jgi:hypothetical protein
MKSKKFKVWLPTLCALSALLLLPACTVTKYTAPSGETFSRYAVGNKTSVGELSIDADAHGVRSVQMKGYSNDQAEVAGAVTAAAVRAALKQ